MILTINYKLNKGDISTGGPENTIILLLPFVQSTFFKSSQVTQIPPLVVSWYFLYHNLDPTKDLLYTQQRRPPKPSHYKKLKRPKVISPKGNQKTVGQNEETKLHFTQLSKCLRSVTEPKEFTHLF